MWSYSPLSCVFLILCQARRLSPPYRHPSPTNVQRSPSWNSNASNERGRDGVSRRCDARSSHDDKKNKEADDLTKGLAHFPLQGTPSCPITHLYLIPFTQNHPRSRPAFSSSDVHQDAIIELGANREGRVIDEHISNVILHDPSNDLRVPPSKIGHRG